MDYDPPFTGQTVRHPRREVRRQLVELRSPMATLRIQLSALPIRMAAHLAYYALRAQEESVQ